MFRSRGASPLLAVSLRELESVGVCDQVDHEYLPVVWCVPDATQRAVVLTQCVRSPRHLFLLPSRDMGSYCIACLTSTAVHVEQGGVQLTVGIM